MNISESRAVGTEYLRRSLSHGVNDSDIVLLRPTVLREWLATRR